MICTEISKIIEEVVNKNGMTYYKTWSKTFSSTKSSKGMHLPSLKFVPIIVMEILLYFGISIKEVIKQWNYTMNNLLKVPEV